VSNGSQTDAIIRDIQKNILFFLILRDYRYEPDAPNYTPRISAICWRDGEEPIAQISILRKSPTDMSCIHTLMSYEAFTPGFGYCVTTYQRDGNPLPAFEGEPYPVPLYGNIDDILTLYWDMLNPDNRVSLAVKFIPRDGTPSVIKIINKYKKVSA
jgi:hypothetical protein